MTVQRILGIVAVVCAVAALIQVGRLDFNPVDLVAYGVAACGVAIAL
jgi:hypothetical protein